MCATMIFQRSRNTMNRNLNVKKSTCSLSEMNPARVGVTALSKCIYARIAFSRHTLSVSHIIIIITSPQRVYASSCRMLSSRFQPKKKINYFYVNTTRTTYKYRGSARCTYCTTLPIIVMTRALSPMENAF